MKNGAAVKYLALAVSFIFIILFFSSVLKIPYAGNILSYIAAPFFAERITPEDLRKKYENGQIKVLIVPGHDDELPGAQFRATKEADLNAKVARYLFDFFNNDDKFKPFITKEKDGSYSQWFLDYVSSNRKAVAAFRKKLKTIMRGAQASGDIKEQKGIEHNSAAESTSIKLYAMNKWANDNDIDIVIHIHFNDYPNRARDKAGKYSGFAIYAPENQLPNSRASVSMALAVKKALESSFRASNLPMEQSTVIEDLDLIAVGSNASRDGVSILIEYGYIYEPQLARKDLAEEASQKYASLTYSGIKNYFEKR